MVWGYFSDSIKIFMLQKKIIRILMGYKSSDFCRKFFFLFRNLSIPFIVHSSSSFVYNKNRN